MKTILLIRHAKSSWNQGRLSDIERPLNKRGLGGAPVMGTRLRKQGIHFDALYSSPARQAIRTAELIASKMDYAAENIQVVPSLYTFNLFGFNSPQPAAYKTVHGVNLSVESCWDGRREMRDKPVFPSLVFRLTPLNTPPPGAGMFIFLDLAGGTAFI